MKLVDIRKEFVRKSGRYDLVQNDDDTFKDAGADFFIRSGQRMLDRKGDWGTGQRAEFYAGLASGQKEFFVDNCWRISSLWWQPTGGQSWDLAEQVYDVQKAMCCRVLGKLYFSIVPERVLPKIGSKSACAVAQPASSLDVAADRFGDDYLNGLKVRISPSCASALNFRIVGNFYSDPLTTDESTNYWTERHPDVLLKAALYELEVFYRNSEGANDWLNAIMMDMRDIADTELMADVGGPVEMGL